MELYIYKGEDNLPSIDFDCLRVTAYIKLTNAPVAINTEGSSLFLPIWSLPYLEIDGKRFKGYDAIVTELKRQGYTLNENSPNQRNLSDAYICLIMKHLYPCLQYYLWGDPQNIDVSRNLYARRMGFPLNFIYPQKYSKSADYLIEIEENFCFDDKLEDHNVSDLLFRAKKELNLLSAKLKDKENLLSGYSEADAIIYALLASLYYIPIPTNPIKQHIQESPNLQKYIDRFCSKFMKDLPVIRSTTSDPTSHKTKTGIVEMDDDKYFAQKTPKVFAILVAGLAMTAFALRQGIFQISRHHEHRINIDYDEDEKDDTL